MIEKLAKTAEVIDTKVKEGTEKVKGFDPDKRLEKIKGRISELKPQNLFDKDARMVKEDTTAVNLTEKNIPEKYKDDNDHIFRNKDKLTPNNRYEVNGYAYETDSKGRIKSAEGKLRIDCQEKRNMEQINRKEHNYKKTDDASHLISRRFGGSDSLENLVPMSSKLNRSDYKKMENTLADTVKSGADVRLKVEPKYKLNSERPSKINVTYTIDGEKEVMVFKNRK